MENGILTTKEIKNGNLLIADFDGLKIVLNANKINYHLDYSKLMLVIEKIAELKIGGYTPLIEISNFGCKIDLSKYNNTKFVSAHGCNLKTNIWVMVVNFLEWYKFDYKN